jgi:uncharacterized protein (TIGR02246 family)
VIQRALTHVVLGVVVVAGGCSSALDEARISAARVEPELEPRSPRGAVGPVPIVIAAPRPYRTARGVAARAAAPRRLPAIAADRALGLRAEVEMALRDYGRDFNRHDVPAVAARWTEQGENLDLDTGETTAGRDAVRDVFAALFTADDDAAIDIDVQAIRPVRGDVAVVDGNSTVRFGDGTRAGSRFSAVMVRQDGRWMLDSVRESADPAAAHAGRPLEQLEWLVGAWEDPAPGTGVRTRCFWSAGRGFLVRTHAVSSPAATAEVAAGIPALLPEAETADREVTEIIGWDPESQVIRSWVFTSAGRFAEGTWTPTSDGWRVRLEGRGGDMGRACECVIARRGPDAVSVSGPRDGLAADLAPVCDVVRASR